MNRFQMPDKNNFDHSTFSIPSDVTVPRAVGMCPFLSLDIRLTSGFYRLAKCRCCNTS